MLNRFCLASPKMECITLRHLDLKFFLKFISKLAFIPNKKIISYNLFHCLFFRIRLYNEINKIIAECPECDGTSRYVTLEDICFQPLYPENKNCTIQSVFQYWQNNEEKIYDAMNDTSNNYASLYEHLGRCTRNPFEIECLSAFGGPIQPFMVVGSYGVNETYLNAGAIVITYVLNNYLDSGHNKETLLKAISWEAEVLELLRNYTNPLFNVYYTTERSIEDEIERESFADIKIIAISYVIMFVYLTITLGKYSTSNIKVIGFNFFFFAIVSKKISKFL